MLILNWSEHLQGYKTIRVFFNLITEGTKECVCGERDITGSDYDELYNAQWHSLKEYDDLLITKLTQILKVENGFSMKDSLPDVVAK